MSSDNHTAESEYHRHERGDVVRGAAIRCIDPDAGARDVIVLDRAGLGERITRLLDENWPNSGVNGWYLTDLLMSTPTGEATEQ